MCWIDLSGLSPFKYRASCPIVAQLSFDTKKTTEKPQSVGEEGPDLTNLQIRSLNPRRHYESFGRRTQQSLNSPPLNVGGDRGVMNPES
jgi:hypothetical protein